MDQHRVVLLAQILGTFAGMLYWGRKIIHHYTNKEVQCQNLEKLAELEEMKKPRQY